MDRKKTLNKLKKISSIVTLLAMLPNSVGATSEELKDKTSINMNIEDDAYYGEYLHFVFNSLPEYLLNFLNYKKTNIVLLDDEKDSDKIYQAVYDEKISKSILGFCDYQNKTIYIEAAIHEGYFKKYPNSSKGLTEDEFNKLIVRNKLIHELGHLLDSYWYFSLSQSDDFSLIFKEEKEKFKQTTSYKVDNFQIEANISDAIEYFASAFACYFTHPADLMEFCPKTYTYISEYLMEIEKNFANKSK